MTEAETDLGGFVSGFTVLCGSVLLHTCFCGQIMDFCFYTCIEVEGKPSKTIADLLALFGSDC